MRYNKRKLYIILICCILCFSSVGVYVYKEKKSTKNILIEAIFNKSIQSEKFYEELLKTYNNENKEKLNRGESIAAEDHFFITYEYYLNRDVDKAKKSLEATKAKQPRFKNRFIELFNEFMECYYSVLENNTDGLNEKINSIYENITIKDWDKYYDLLYGYFLLSANIEGGIDNTTTEIEKLLKQEEKLNPNCIIMLKDILASTYMHKGQYAKALEKCLQIKSLIDSVEFDLELGNYYNARNKYSMGVIYQTLENYDTAKELLEEAANIKIKDQAYDENIKIEVLYNLSQIYMSEDNIDKIYELLEEYKEYIDEDNPKNMDLLYDYILTQYHIAKYEISNSREELDKAKYCLEKMKNYSMDIRSGIVIDFDKRSEVFVYYLEYLDGHVEEAIEHYNDLLSISKETAVKEEIINKMISIYCNEGKYEEAYKMEEMLMEIKSSEYLEIYKDYSQYSLEKYEYELEIRQKNKEQIKDYLIRVILVFILIISVSIMFKKIRSLKKKNISDGLTGIYNRRYFDDLYKKKLLFKEDFFLFVFDLDNFKKINDTYGHMVGDDVLRRVSNTAKEVVGSNGKVFRYGGEEFAVIANIKDKTKIKIMAEEIRKKVEELIWDNGMKVTISMGVANSTIEKERVLEVADNRLYISKTTGKNKVTFIN